MATIQGYSDDCERFKQLCDLLDICEPDLLAIMFEALDDQQIDLKEYNRYSSVRIIKESRCK